MNETKENTAPKEPQVKFPLLIGHEAAIGATIKDVHDCGAWMSVHFEDGRVWLLHAEESMIWTEPTAHVLRTHTKHDLRLLNEDEFRAWKTEIDQWHATRELAEKRAIFNRLKKELEGNL